MNFQTKLILSPLKVLIVNSLTPAGQMTIENILSGKVFGLDQLVDLVLLVYSNENVAAESLIAELIECGYPCYNKITVSSDLPSILDADIYCFLSNFSDPNKIELDKINNDEQFDALYLIIKVANNFHGHTAEETLTDDGVKFQKKTKAVTKVKKPIIMTDGLVTLNIMKILSKDLPLDIFFCPTAIPDIAISILGEHLKVTTDIINKPLVWAGNDEVFHVEIKRPLIFGDGKNEAKSKCDWDMISKDLLRSFHDDNQISPSWMKTEYMEKVAAAASKNPYGCIFRAASFCNTLKSVWETRKIENTLKYFNLGVISDGSLGTIKGLPYVLPIIMRGDSWTINNYLEEDSHLKNEIKRINKIVKTNHEKLAPYCKKFLQDNIINQAFIPVAESSLGFSVEESTKSSYSP